ncbi:MAG: carbohydrate ABC transporter permease [Ruminococcaceae bacterium]|nr:carbohydrate ABC transporter permease [Oscillospiraceae bacterium]
MAQQMSSIKKAEQAYTRKIMLQSVLRTVICILITIVCLLPIYIIVINATRDTTDIINQGVSLLPGGSLIQNFQSLHDPDAAEGLYVQTFSLWRGYANSLIIAVFSTALTVFFSGMTAYGLTVYDFRLKKAATTFVLMIMMIPTQVVSTGFLQFMVQLKLYDSYIPIILPAIAAPSVVFFMLQYMRSSFPAEIVEAARIDGCGEFMTFLRISLPMLKPAFAVQAIFAFVTSWNNYYTPSMLLISDKMSQRTMPMMVYSIIGNDKIADFGVKYLVVCLSILPVVIVYLCLSKFIVKGVALGAVKG